MRINSVKINRLKSVINQAMDRNLHTSCSSKNLTIEGYNVKISDILHLECWSSANTIEIFARNKIFFDADIDKTGQSAQLSIIAPIWEIRMDDNPSHSRKIVLNGEKGTEFQSSATDGSSHSENGRKGEPGQPGGPGGCIFGVASRFINDQHLEIHVNGGNGGSGQHGGRG